MTRALFASSRPGGQAGATMIEVLVTIAVVSLGLLGYAGLVMKSQQSNHAAYSRSVATMLAYNITECMRANRAAALAGGYNVAIGSSPAGSGIASTDLTNWKADMSAALPSGDGSVTVDLQGNVTIIVRWNEKRDGTYTSFTTQTAL